MTHFEGDGCPCPECESEEAYIAVHGDSEWEECHNCGWLDTPFESLPPKAQNIYLDAWNENPPYEGENAPKVNTCQA